MYQLAQMDAKDSQIAILEDRVIEKETEIGDLKN